MLNTVAGRLIDSDVPVAAVHPIFDGLESLVLGDVLRQQCGEVARDLGPSRLDHLDAAAHHHVMSADRLVDVAALAIMDAVVAAHASD